jgi:hypothetical protein
MRVWPSHGHSTLAIRLPGVQVEEFQRLCLAGSFQRPVDRGHGVRGMDERDAAQGEPVRQTAGERQGPLLPLRTLISGSTTLGRRAATRELLFRALQEHEVLRLAQLNLRGQGLGGRHSAADGNTRRGARQPEEDN